jgi:hypothetical protein
MMAIDADTAAPLSVVEKKESTRRREAFFLEFTEKARRKYPSVILLLTGGFRTKPGILPYVA